MVPIMPLMAALLLFPCAGGAEGSVIADTGGTFAALWGGVDGRLSALESQMRHGEEERATLQRQVDAGNKNAARFRAELETGRANHAAEQADTRRELEVLRAAIIHVPSEKSSVSTGSEMTTSDEPGSMPEVKAQTSRAELWHSWLGMQLPLNGTRYQSSNTTMAGVERLTSGGQETTTFINHRRQMAEGGPCSADEIARQIDAINIECCDEPSEDCSGGKVHSCNAGCSALLDMSQT